MKITEQKALQLLEDNLKKYAEITLSEAKITDLLAERADLIIRYQGGCNAGHTVVANGNTYKFHLIPSGILYDNTVCLIGAGTVIHPESFEKEMNELKAQGVDFKNLKISPLNVITIRFQPEVFRYRSGNRRAVAVCCHKVCTHIHHFRKRTK